MAVLSVHRDHCVVSVTDNGCCLTQTSLAVLVSGRQDLANEGTDVDLNDLKAQLHIVNRATETPVFIETYAGEYITTAEIDYKQEASLATSIHNGSCSSGTRFMFAALLCTKLASDIMELSLIIRLRSEITGCPRINVDFSMLNHESFETEICRLGLHKRKVTSILERIVRFLYTDTSIISLNVSTHILNVGDAIIYTIVCTCSGHTRGRSVYELTIVDEVALSSQRDENKLTRLESCPCLRGWRIAPKDKSKYAFFSVYDCHGRALANETSLVVIQNISTRNSTDASTNATSSPPLPLIYHRSRALNEALVGLNSPNCEWPHGRTIVSPARASLYISSIAGDLWTLYTVTERPDDTSEATRERFVSACAKALSNQLPSKDATRRP